LQAVPLGVDLKDYYAILGLPESAGPAAINDAKRRLSFLYHPDTRAKDLDPAFAEERLRNVNEAWDTLSSPAKRANYNRLRTTTRGTPGQTGSDPNRGQKRDEPAPGHTFGAPAPEPSRQWASVAWYTFLGLVGVMMALVGLGMIGSA